MAKKTLDFKKEYKELYNPSKKEPSIVKVPKFKFIMIDGKGDPNKVPEYVKAIEALYAIAYTIRMMPKKGIQPKGYFEYVVPPLQGLWWADNMKEFASLSKDKWKWTMMIMQPDFVDVKLFKQAQDMAKEKKDNPSINDVRLEDYKEGESVQILYIGSYSDEHETIVNLHEFAENRGYELRGKHHEIYLSDPRKVEAKKLKTVIRQPITKK